MKPVPLDFLADEKFGQPLAVCTGKRKLWFRGLWVFVLGGYVVSWEEMEQKINDTVSPSRTKRAFGTQRNWISHGRICQNPEAIHLSCHHSKLSPAPTRAYSTYRGHKWYIMIFGSRTRHKPA
ncbi:hypothetical protein K435DRAFT_72169 [Dendrothele bispora CBS 962.96]|uniref:Uncharacterized protein n=1 Tax=Dendrothele bispora (strain CBS 962.96) TaxID=1314807 RepID=A0A4S8KRC9_DENBC|nr:hypothetical protein K435DRAFT_72169 [Dendrothele bispora CBS 962.96]